MPTQHAAQPSADKLAASITEALKFEGINSIYSRPITKTDLAEFLGVSLRTVDSYVSNRRIPYIKLGRLVRFRLADVERALQRFTVEEVALR